MTAASERVDTTDHSRRAPLSPLKRLARSAAITVLAVVAIAILGALAHLRIHALRRDAALERIRAAGEPVFASDVPQRAEPDAATLVWMRELVALPELVADESLVRGADAEDYRTVIAELAAADVQPAVQVAAGRFDLAVQRQVARLGRGDEDLSAYLRTFDPWSTDAEQPLDEAELAWLELLAAGNAAHCELARRSRGLAPITLRESRALDPDEPAWLAGIEPYYTHALVTALNTHWRLRVARGDFAAAADDVHAIRDIAALFSEPTDVYGAQSYANIHTSYLYAVEGLIEAAPSQFDASALVVEFPRARFIDVLRGAARAERALWNEHCVEVAAHGLFPPEDEVLTTPRQRWLGWLFRARNQAWVLDGYERELASIDLDPDARRRLPEPAPPPSGTRLGDLRYPGVLAALDAIERAAVEAAFLRVLIAWQHEGADAAQLVARSIRDPYGSGVLHSAREDGKLRVWSVGANGVDDHGRTTERHRGPDDVLFERRWR